jgi:predicted esterase
MASILHPPSSVLHPRFFLLALLLLAGGSAFADPPQITSAYYLQAQAVHVGTSTSFQVYASGTEPLSYQWRRDGCDLPDQTNSVLALNAIQPADEGDYTVAISNPEGAITSEPVRLWVVRPASDYIKRDFTNSAGLRLPYWYLLPTNYDAGLSYPLHCHFHGKPGDELLMTNASGSFAGYLNYPGLKVFASYRQQVANPMIEVWPARRAGDASVSWNDDYLRLVSGMLDTLISEFNVDTNRLYVSGYSEGVHAAWDMVGLRPGFFAAASVAAGWQGSTPAASLKDVPFWVWCARNDSSGQLGNTRSLISALRRIGGNPIYTEYASGAHIPAICMGASSPAYVDWLLGQRRGLASTNEPLLCITNPTGEAVCVTGGTNLNLAGCAQALGQAVTSLSWENTANGRTGVAAGSNLWSATGIPLVANQTNLILVTATTTSWAPVYGGSTTFHDTLTVFSSPLRMSLKVQGQNAILSWTGGGGPYSILRATDLKQCEWTTVVTNAVSPAAVTLESAAAFFRVAGQ